MAISPLAGKPAPQELLVDLTRLEREYDERRPDLGDRNQLVRFGTSGHRGSPLHGSFTEAHILAITQAICDYRRGRGTDGPLYMGKDTHALSGPAQRTALEVLAANQVETIIQTDRDYLGALQRYRVEHPQDIHLLSMSSFLVDYPFANRLYPGSLDVLERFRSWGQTVILSDGDVVFQPRKVERSGIFEAVDGNVLIYIHKEEALEDVARRYPAQHYVLVDDKLRILTTVKQAWTSRVTTVFPRQGQYAHDPNIIAACPPADLTVERIGDLLNYDLPALLVG